MPHLTAEEPRTGPSRCPEEEEMSLGDLLSLPWVTLALNRASGWMRRVLRRREKWLHFKTQQCP